MAVPEAGRKPASPLRDALERHEVLAAGILSGVAAGVAMMAAAMVGAAMQDVPPLHPLEVIGESFLGPEVLGGAAKVALGALVHVLTSAALGIVFAGIVSREFGTTCAMGLGVGVTLFAMGFMMSTFVPWVNPGFRGAFQVIGGTWVVAHAVFGVTVGMAPSLRRWISRAAIAPAPAGELGAPRAAPVVTSPHVG